MECTRAAACLLVGVVFLLTPWSEAGQPDVRNCTEGWVTQQVDHFAWTTPATFQQRYYTFDRFWSQVSACPPSGRSLTIR